MIGSIKGKLLAKHAPQVLIEAFGVGYEIELPTTNFAVQPEIGDEVFLYTHLQVREDAQTLYGFIDIYDRQFFRNLLKINGVGAKLALAILSSMTVSTFEEYVRAEDSDALVKIPGVGKKTAERLVIEMRDRLITSEVTLIDNANHAVRDNPINEAFDALIALGYKSAQVKKLMTSIKGTDLSASDIIRQALKRVND